MSTGQRKNARQNNRKQLGPNETDTVRKSAVRKTEGMITQYPMSSALVMFGVGLGLGVAIGSILCSVAAPPPSFGQRAELAAEKLGRQMLDAIAGVLPQSIARHVA